MRITVIITSNEIEKSWNAIRYMNTALEMGHFVSAFLVNSGVEIEFIDHESFDIALQLNTFIEKRGILYSCGTCLQKRKLHEKSTKSIIGTMMDCVTLTEEADRVITF